MTVRDGQAHYRTVRDGQAHYRTVRDGQAHYRTVRDGQAHYRTVRDGQAHYRTVKCDTIPAIYGEMDTHTCWSIISCDRSRIIVTTQICPHYNT